MSHSQPTRANRLMESRALVRMLVASASGAGVVVLGFLYWQTTVANGLWMAFRAAPVAWLAVAGVIAFGGATILRRARRRPKVVTGGIAALFLACLIALLILRSYVASHGLAESINYVSGSGAAAKLPSFKPRAPHEIADSQAVDNVTINGSPDLTTYIPESDHFGTLVVTKGLFKGYGQIVWQQIGASGQATTHSCGFSASAQERLGGSFSHNLTRAIENRHFGILIDSDDTYGYCDEAGTPIVVVPFKAYSGFWFPHQVPAGVAIYNGATGELRILTHVAQGQVPGPVYPLSLAASQRDASTASSGFFNYVQQSTGYQAASGDNTSDYILANAGGPGDAYVTPLTRVGAGQAITDVGYVAGSQLSAGQLNPYSIVALPAARQGNSAVAARAKSDYADLPWATGMSLFEIVPSAPDQWLATLGQAKAIMYRLRINADGSSCLFTTEFAQLRCSADLGTATNPSSGTSATGGVGAMTDQQLLQLEQQIQAEIARRLTNHR